MLSKFVSSIKKTIPLNHNVIAAVSGGVDSMVLCDLLLKSEINFSIAHINYMLRGIDKLIHHQCIYKVECPYILQLGEVHAIMGPNGS